jgi:hypothetical protein
MEVFSYGKKKNNEDFLIVFKIMSGNHSDIKAPVTLTFELVTKTNWGHLIKVMKDFVIKRFQDNEQKPY